MRKLVTGALLAIGITLPVLAGEVEIVQVELNGRAGSWRVAVALRHADSGWDHYADAWRVVSESGTVLGTRTLYHPHVEEQPFTRNLGGVVIPEKTSVIFVEAHDKVHGWATQRVRVELDKPEGERYRISR